MRITNIFALWGLSGAFYGLASPAPKPPPTPIEHASYNITEIRALAGDSLKVAVSWQQAADSAANGNIDSTVYALRSSKPAVFYGGASLAANTDTRRSKNATTFADSFKLARPSPGDSAVFQVKSFVQCRKGDCSIPGGAGFKYRANFAPPASSPSGTSVTVF